MARNQRPTAAAAVDTVVDVKLDVEREIRVLQTALREVDRVTQGRTEDMVALARAVMRCLDSPADPVAMRDARRLVEQMQVHAEELGNCVNFEAEERGCNYVEARA